MNILFYTFYNVAQGNGGISRVCEVAAEQFIEFCNYNCYLAYQKESSVKSKKEVFEKRFYIGKPSAKSHKKLVKILVDCNIDVIINETVIEGGKFLADAIKASGRDIKVIFAHHYFPGTDHVGTDLNQIIHSINLSKNGIRNFIKLLAFPILSTRRFKIPRYYRDLYTYSDALTEFTSDAVNKFTEIAKINDKSKFHDMPNSLSFDYIYPADKLNEKKKHVLIVARLIERPKNISSALRIWRMVEADPELNDWQLDIVGDGESENVYKSYAKQYLKRVKFYGKCDPLPFYKEDSLFLMLSKFEAFGVTLTEAMQCGCVPIAYNSYAAVREIIHSGKTGMLITPYDEKEFFEQMKSLMINYKERNRLAENAIKDVSQRFSREQLVAQWLNILSTIGK